MAQADGSIAIEVKVDTSEAEKALKGLDKGTDKVADAFDGVKDASKNAEKAAFSFGDALKANVLSNAIMSGFSMLTNAVGGFASGMIGTAADLKAEASQFTQTFGEMEGTATKVISGIAQQTGILETRLNGAATSIYAFARSSGGSEMQSMELMEGALTAAADAAAYYDRSLDETTEQLMSFLKGNYENDAALGLSATETTRNAAAMELFGKEFNDLTEIQKQQTLLKMVTDAQELSGAMGQASRESDGLENVMGNLNEVGRQIQGNLGAPILEAIIPAIQRITDSLIQWSEGVDWEAFSGALNNFITGIINNGPTIISIIAGIGAGFIAWKATTMIQGVVTALSSLIPALTGATASQTGLNTAMSANPVGVVVTAITSLITIIGTLWATNEDFRNAVTEIWEKIKSVFLGAWDAIKGAWDQAAGFFSGIWESIKETYSTVKDVLSGFFVNAWNTIKTAWSVAVGFFTSIWSGIKTVFSPVVDYLSGQFSNAIESIKQVFGGIIDFIAGVFTGDWSRAWDGISNIFKGVWNGIVGSLEGAVNLIIRGINWLISQLNKVSFSVPDWVPGIGGNRFGFDIPKISEISIPRLAAGAVVPPNREFMAVLGDNKKETEIVSPLSTMKQALIEALQEAGGMSGGTIEVKLLLDGKELARNQVKHINQLTQQAGKPVLLI